MDSCSLSIPAPSFFMPVAESSSRAAALRFAGRSIVGLAVLLVAGEVLNLLVLGLSVHADGPDAGHDNPRQATSILGFLLQTADKVGWVILIVLVFWLLVRRLPRLAGYLAVTAGGSHLLTAGGGALLLLIDSTPAVSVFTAMTGVTVTCGAVLLVFLPVVSRKRRGRALAATIILIVAIAVLSVLGGAGGPYSVGVATLLGAAWLAVTAVAYSRWRREEGAQVSLTHGLAPEHREQLVLAPAHQGAFPKGWRGFGLLVATGVAICIILIGIGLLVTGVLVQVQQFDSTVVEWFADHRTPFLSTVALAFDVVGNTPGIIVVLLVAVPLSLAITRRWAPALFLLFAAVGETALYLTVGAVVGRPRPSVDHLWLTVPPTSSFPSGHVAASVVTYFGIALLVVAWGRGWLRFATVALAAVLVLGVIFGRLYWGMHFPTDVLTSVVYGFAWLRVCWWALRPQRGATA